MIGTDIPARPIGMGGRSLARWPARLSHASRGSGTCGHSCFTTLRSGWRRKESQLIPARCSRGSRGSDPCGLRWRKRCHDPGIGGDQPDAFVGIYFCVTYSLAGSKKGDPLARVSKGDGPVGEPGEREEVLAESSRVEAFSDGVFAIALTLLVLGLHAPQGRGTMLHQLLLQWPAYVSYLSSFAYVGVSWVNHHQLFNRVERVDSGLLWRNLILLLTTSVVPFPTAVVGSAFQVGTTGDQKVGMVFYALVCSANAASWFVVYAYLHSNRRLLSEATPIGFFALQGRRALIGAVTCIVICGFAFWQPLVGLVIAALLPVFYGLTSEGRLFRRANLFPRSLGPHN
jgi:uncharacterized membrane protein